MVPDERELVMSKRCQVLNNPCDAFSIIDANLGDVPSRGPDIVEHDWNLTL
jgi:hypothetical protein